MCMSQNTPEDVEVPGVLRMRIRALSSGSVATRALGGWIGSPSQPLQCRPHARAVPTASVRFGRGSRLCVPASFHLQR